MPLALRFNRTANRCSIGKEATTVALKRVKQSWPFERGFIALEGLLEIGCGAVDWRLLVVESSICEVGATLNPTTVEAHWSLENRFAADQILSVHRVRLDFVPAVELLAKSASREINRLRIREQGWRLRRARGQGERRGHRAHGGSRNGTRAPWQANPPSSRNPASLFLNEPLTVV